jgi:hypothetical protein
MRNEMIADFFFLQHSSISKRWTDPPLLHSLPVSLEASCLTLFVRSRDEISQHVTKKMAVHMQPKHLVLRSPPLI